MKELVDRYPFDAVLMALNAADKHHNPYIEKLLPAAVEKNMGIIGMKIPARDRIFSHGGIISMKEAMSYTLSLAMTPLLWGLTRLPNWRKMLRLPVNLSP